MASVKVYKIKHVDLKKSYLLRVIGTIVLICLFVLFIINEGFPFDDFNTYFTSILFLLVVTSFVHETFKIYKKLGDSKQGKLHIPYFVIENRILTFTDDLGHQERYRDFEIEEIKINSNQSKIFIRTSSILNNIRLYDEYDMKLDDIYNILMDRVYK